MLVLGSFGRFGHIGGGGVSLNSYPKGQRVNSPRFTTYMRPTLTAIL